jgi:type IV pilus assembly protein PilQ
VEIEARVISASRAFASDLGTQLGFAGASTTTHNQNLFSGAPQVGGSPGTVTTTPPPPPFSPPTATTGGSGIPLITNFGAAGPTSGFGYSFRSANFALDFFITAAESKGVGKLLSKPRIVTQNNEKAIIKQGVKLPIQTTVNNTISVQFIDAVLQLEVTPQITGEGTIFMDVLVENTQIDQGIPRVQGIPALDTQSAQTKVLVQDGGTVVIGGIIVSTQNTNIQEVPIVGSLPIIGNLFKRTTISIQSQELLFFLTPRIIPG